MSLNTFSPAKYNYAPPGYGQTLYAAPPQYPTGSSMLYANPPHMQIIPEQKTIMADIPPTIKQSTQTEVNTQKAVLSSAPKEQTPKNTELVISVKKHNNGERSIVLDNVDEPSAIQIVSDTLQFKREVGLKGQMLFTFAPDSKVHYATIMNDGKEFRYIGLQPEDLNKNVKYAITGDEKKSFVELSNVDDPEHVSLQCDTLTFQKSVLDNNKVTFAFTPDTQRHVVTLNKNNDLKKTFTIKPKESYNKNVTFKVLSENDKKYIELYNVEKSDLLNIASDTIEFKKVDVSPTTVRFYFEPKNDTHIAVLTSDNKTISKFGLKPKNQIQNQNLEIEVKGSGNNKFVELSHFTRPELLSFESPTLKMAAPVVDGDKLLVSFTPDDSEHILTIYNDGVFVKKIGLRPRVANVKFAEPKEELHRFEVEGVENPKKISVLSNEHLTWSVASENGKHFVQFVPPAKPQIMHIMTKTYSGKEVMANNGQIMLAPKDILKKIPAMETLSNENPTEKESPSYSTPKDLLTSPQGPAKQNVQAESNKPIVGKLIMTGSAKRI